MQVVATGAAVRMPLSQPPSPYLRQYDLRSYTIDGATAYQINIKNVADISDESPNLVVDTLMRNATPRIIIHRYLPIVTMDNFARSCIALEHIDRLIR